MKFEITDTVCHFPDGDWVNYRCTAGRGTLFVPATGTPRVAGGCLPQPNLSGSEMRAVCALALAAVRADPMGCRAELRRVAERSAWIKTELEKEARAELRLSGMHFARDGSGVGVRGPWDRSWRGVTYYYRGPDDTFSPDELWAAARA